MDYSHYDKYQNEREKKPEKKSEILPLPPDVDNILGWENKKELEQLAIGKQSEFLIKYKFGEKEKNKALLTSLVGCHYWYFGDWNMQIIFWATLGGLGLWAIVDIFRISKLLNKYNKKLALKILNEVEYSS